MRRYRQFVAIHSPTEVRDAQGGVSYTYAVVAGLERVPATIMRSLREDKVETMTPITATHRIVLAGHHPEILATWAIIDGNTRYDVRTVSPTIGRRATVIMAEKVDV